MLSFEIEFVELNKDIKSFKFSNNAIYLYILL